MTDHESDGRTQNPDVMVVPPTPKPTHKAEVLVRVTPTIASSCEENTVLWKWHWSRLRCARWNPETKSKVRISTVHLPHPNHTPVNHTNAMGECAIQIRWAPYRHPSQRWKPMPSPRVTPTIKIFWKIVVINDWLNITRIYYWTCLRYDFNCFDKYFPL